MSEAKQVPVLMTEPEARAFLTRWLGAWVGGPSIVPTLLSFYAPDAFYRDPNVPAGIQGHPALRDFFTQMFANHPDWKFEVAAVYPTSKGFVMSWSAWIPLQDGRELKDYRGVDILEFRDGLIAKHENYFDLSVFLTK